MTLDMLDAAFVARWQSRTMVPPSSAPVVVPPAVPSLSAPAAVVPVPPVAVAPESPAVPAADDRPLVDRLLEAAPQDWEALAVHVERARNRGRRVIAVAGCERGEGRTTLLHCLATTLRGRGRDVVCVEPVEMAAAAAAGGGVSHDKRIVLVDAGIWFPPGPVRRQVLTVASHGCEAAILTRRADRPGIGPRAAMLASFGIEVLGEVVTFTEHGT
jgi:hypothetical protein